MPEKKDPKLSKAHKAKVTVTFLKEQNIQVLAHPTYSVNPAPCDFGLFPLVKEKFPGRKGSRIHFRTSQKQQIQSSTNFLYPIINILLNLGLGESALI